MCISIFICISRDELHYIRNLKFSQQKEKCQIQREVQRLEDSYMTILKMPGQSPSREVLAGEQVMLDGCDKYYLIV